MIRLILLYGAALLVGLIVQATLFHSLFPSAVAPDFISILVFTLGIRFRNSRGAVGAFLLGLAADFASARFAGPNAAGATAAFYFVAMSSTHVFAESGVTAGFLSGLSCVVKSAVYAGMLAYFAGVQMNSGDVWTLAMEAFLTGALTPLFLWLSSDGARSVLSRRRSAEPRLSSRALASRTSGAER